MNNVKPIQEKEKKNQMEIDLPAKKENPNILLYVQPHPQGILPSDIGRQGLSIIGLSIIGHLNINSTQNKFEMLCQ